MSLDADAALALRAFEDGFARGADMQRGHPGRHRVDVHTHVHWKRGYDAGLAAVDKARDEYAGRLLAARK